MRSRNIQASFITQLGSPGAEAEAAWSRRLDIEQQRGDALKEYQDYGHRSQRGGNIVTHAVTLALVHF